MNKTLKIENDELLQRVYNGKQNFTESELAYLAYEYARFDFIKGDDRRWSSYCQTILKIEDRYFLIGFDQGLTENQEDYFDSQPIEVELKETEKTIIERDYVRK